MEAAHTTPDIYVHIRIIIGIVLGLSIARLLTGLARFVQHPSREQVYLVHLGWAFFLLLSVVLFWWWEFRLENIEHWHFEAYLLVISYAILFFLLCTLLFPDRMDEYSGFKGYFLSRRKWFFGLLAATFVVDLADTALKGADYFQSFGPEYPIRNVTYIALCIVAMFVANPVFQGTFVAASLVYQLSWIFRQFETLP